MISWNKILTTLVTLASVAFIGGILDFQNIKAQVKTQQSRLEVISVLICKYAIRDGMKDAEVICHDVMKGKK